MSLLGEIVKSNQALRYHAKSSEIAGKNLAHVNDENYARQRVLSRDGSMYRDVGSLGTTALEMGGLDHARSQLLDRRVVDELGETSALEARKEVLDLLQSVLGERIVREGVNVGLDDHEDSDLAPGSLTRALNDFFNAFQELSAAPDELTVRQELFHKAHTLGKRFNEAGEKFDDIERDLTETVKETVEQINAILVKIHEVNKQVRRFELQDKGKAATYRDRRQQLLEGLARHLDVKVEEDMEAATGKPSGLLNLFVSGAKGEKINLLDPAGPKVISTDWRQDAKKNELPNEPNVLLVGAPTSPTGTPAKVRAKIGADGKLGQVEIIDGGSGYSDKNGPVLVAFAPPERKEVATDAAVQNAAALAQAVAGEAALQAGQPVDGGPALANEVGGAPAVVAAESAVELNPPANLASVGTGYDPAQAPPVVTLTGGDAGTLTAAATVKPDGTLDVSFAGTPSGSGNITVQVAQGPLVNPADLAGVGQGFDPAGPAPAVTITGTDAGTLAGTATVNQDGTLDISFTGTATGTGNLSLVATVEGAAVSVPPIFSTPLNASQGTTTDKVVQAADLGDAATQALGGGTTAPYALEKGEVFHFDGSYYQALDSTAKGENLADEKKFLKLTDIPNGTVREYVWQFSDLESYAKGEQFYHKGKLYQSTGQLSPVVTETGGTASQAYASGEVMLHQGTYYQAYKNVAKLQTLPTSTAAGEKTAEGFIVLGASLPSIDKTEGVRSIAPGASQSIKKGEVFVRKTIDAVAITNGGTGYQVGDQVVFSAPEEPAEDDGAKTAAAATVSTVDATGAITGITITSYGLGYNSPPTITINSTAGTGAELTPSITSDDKYYIAIKDFDTGGSNAKLFDPSEKNPATGESIHAENFVEVSTFIDNSVQAIDRTKASLSYKAGDILYDADTDSHYQVKRSFPELNGPQLNSTIRIKEFKPDDSQWETYLKKVQPALSGTDKTSIIRRSNRTQFDAETAPAVELNLGLAEAILQKGEIVGFSLMSEGKGYPPPDSLFINGLELNLQSGSIHGYQRLRLEEMEVFRNHLNGLAKDFVTEINKLYNPTDEPGGYVYGFQGFLSRPVQNRNEFLEEVYDLRGVEGDGEFVLYRDEVDLVVPYPEKDTFQVTFSAPIYPEELAGQVPYYRQSPSKDAELLAEMGDAAKIYASARRMKHVTVEQDALFAGDDGIVGTQDDGRMIMSGYEKIPFRMQQGEKTFVFGDSFEFDSVPFDSWNVAKSMRVNKGFTVENIKATVETVEGANDIALAIAEKGNGEFTDRVASMNAAIGNSLSDVGDNLDHQKAVERLLLDERQAVSSVSIDEEVADLMRFQRSFQASAKVLSTMDRMLELVVMGLIR